MDAPRRARAARAAARSRDRRALSIDLTAPGRARVEERRRPAAAALEPAVAALSAQDRARLAALLARLAGALEP